MFHSILPFVVDFALGILLGLVGGVFGIGGGLMAVPALIWIYGMDQQLAQGTALVMVAPNVLLGFWRYQQRNNMNQKPALLLAGSSIIATYLPAKFATSISAESLRIGFAFFLMALAGVFLYGLRHQEDVAVSRIVLHEKWLGVLGAFSGLCSGLFTIGGGILVAPSLTHFFGIKKQTIAQGYSLATVVPGAFIALTMYSFAHQVDWSIGVPLAIGGMMSISWGVALAHFLPERKLRILFSGLLAFTGFALLK